MIASIMDRETSCIGRVSCRESVCRQAMAILGKSPYLPLRTLRCNYEAGQLTLRGEVPTYYLKQLAQSAISDIECPNGFSNLIHVLPPGAILAKLRRQ